MNRLTNQSKPMENLYTLKSDCFNFQMSPDGFELLGKKLKEADGKNPQVYIHIGAEGILENQVLRIGKAEAGAHTRWISSSNGHQNTFMWAIGKCKKYGKLNAFKYPDYLLFFASLLDLNTKLCVISFDDANEARSYEKALQSAYNPIWEQFLKLPRSNSIYPILKGQKKNEEIVSKVAHLGGALEYLTMQRNGEQPFSSPLQDVLHLDLQSKKIWENELFNEV